MSSSTQTQQASAKQLSLIGKLKLLPTMAMCCALAVASVVTGYFCRPEERPPTKQRQFYYTLWREVPARTTFSQLHAVFPTTDEQYTMLCKKHGMNPKTETLEDGTTAHWIGPRSAEKIIMYYHGGGYVFPSQEGHMNLMWQMQQMLWKAKKDVAVLFLSYDLAPVAQYPRQLQQAISLLHHTIYTLKKAPENIIVYGDSSGGNLATAVLSHISHPHPSTTTPIELLTLSKPLRGVILASPWMSFAGTSKSFFGNEQTDLFSPRTALRWSEAYLGTLPPHASNTDPYNQGLSAAPEWWQDVQVKDVLIVAGKQEILIDDIEAFIAKLTAVKKEVQVVIGEREAHGAPCMDLNVPFKDVTEQTKAVQRWLVEKC